MGCSDLSSASDSSNMLQALFTMCNFGTAVWNLIECVFGELWRFCKCLVRLRESEPKELKENKRKFSEKPKMRKKFCRDQSKVSLNKSGSVSKESMDTASVGLDDIE